MWNQIQLSRPPASSTSTRLVGVGGEPIGQKAAGRARTDDDVVILAVDRICQGHALSLDLARQICSAVSRARRRRGPALPLHKKNVATLNETQDVDQNDGRRTDQAAIGRSRSASIPSRRTSHMAEMSFAERVRHVRTTCGVSETVDRIVPVVPKIPTQSSSIVPPRIPSNDSTCGMTGETTARVAALPEPLLLSACEERLAARAPFEPGTTVPEAVVSFLVFARSLTRFPRMAESVGEPSCSQQDMFSQLSLPLSRLRPYRIPPRRRKNRSSFLPPRR